MLVYECSQPSTDDNITIERAQYDIVADVMNAEVELIVKRRITMLYELNSNGHYRVETKITLRQFDGVRRRLHALAG